MDPVLERVVNHLSNGGRLWLFLDYDGTLADFAPTPDTIMQDKALVSLFVRLALFPEILRVVIMSGRRLSHIEKLLPVPGILRAGTYGIEYMTWEGERLNLLDFETERPFLDQVKAAWQELVDDQPGIYLEDKGFALALHGKDAPDNVFRKIRTEAAQAAAEVVGRGVFRVQGGNKFLEVAPVIADKGQSVSTLLKRFPWPNADIVYIGDDDKDEAGFKAVKTAGGVGILVTAEKEPRPTQAEHCLENPQQVRAWLEELANRLQVIAGSQPVG